jgi:uncharacterized Zn finger protein
MDKELCEECGEELEFICRTKPNEEKWECTECGRIHLIIDARGSESP